MCLKFEDDTQKPEMYHLQFKFDFDLYFKIYLQMSLLLSDCL